MKIFARCFLLLCICLYAFSSHKRRGLENVGPLLPILAQDPIQKPTKESKFEFEYRGKNYLVEPLAEYELTGLVVTHNDISAFSDIYHTEDSVDFRDICVIWGENATNTAFKNVKFWSEPWSCHVSFLRGAADGFSLRDLSNNHLLTDEESVRNRIMQMNIGDQIHLRGQLVSYAEVGHESYPRKSSMSREDEGNGACEVMFVEEAEILKQGPLFWRRVNDYAFYLSVGTAFAMFFNFLYSAYAPMMNRGKV